MERYWHLLLDVWREACRHIALDEAASRIAPILGRRMPITRLFVRQIDPGRGLVETIGTGSADGAIAPLPSHTECSAEQIRRIEGWLRKPTVLHGEASRHAGDCRLPIAPDGLTGDMLAVPLRGATGHHGLLILSARPGRRFDDEHFQLADALAGPMAAALENDRRLHELVTLREAAEADKRSLLTRLGRASISDAIVGADTGLRLAMERVNQAAPADIPVLLLGETGSGKEVLARAIHQRSRRAAGPFLRVNCGAIPGELIDSELFGHEKGSFTGAVETRAGWFEQADGGSLFLDEVAELPPAAQVRFLRILQDGLLKRVGGNKAMTIDVRIIAATHRNLAAMVAEGQFREDLWYRLAVFPIRIPPLRERVADIPPLASHFALRAARRFGMPPIEPSSDDMVLLQHYPWPGNARELQSVLDRAVILGEGRRLEIRASLGQIDQASPAKPDRPAPADPPPKGTPFLDLDSAMKLHIEAALARTQGKVSGRGGAAALLRINAHTLRARMRKLGIEWSRFRSSAAE